MKSEKPEVGLSDENRYLLVGLVFIALLLWGPVNLGFAVRLTYLILGPLFFWLILKYAGKHWNAGALGNDRLNRAIVSAIAVGFFVFAYQSYAAKYHSECTQRVQTRDGSECVGDYETVPGRDMEGVVLWSLLGVSAGWYAISERKQQ